MERKKESKSKTKKTLKLKKVREKKFHKSSSYFVATART